MSEATLQALREAGANVDALNPAERRVFESLSPEEVAVVSAIQARLNGAGEVAGQGVPSDSNQVNVLC
ncbi:hypothetical protein OG271_18505 [Micromonospora rifamycinica]|uniref:aroma-sacti cluster domain-containing protein n=1 Tax=Micromonospora rifamycinica TaxID=291594 RepID=UPI002E2E24C8|nr:aroma-sacti cluster domain-containing protein [Micromonospora rifamycinica]